MRYVRLMSRGHWLKVIHTTSDAGIRTHCGRRLSGFQCEVQLSADRPDGVPCKACQAQVAERGEAAWR